jgi:hypothetical protein
MEDRTSGRIGSHGFSRIRRVWLAGRGFSGLTGCGFKPLSSAGAPPSPDFSPSRQSWRIGAPWAHGSTGPSSWVRLPLSRSLGLSALSPISLSISRVSLSRHLSLYPSSLSLNLWLSLPLSHCVRARRKKEEERRKKNRRGKIRKEEGRRAGCRQCRE